MDASVEKLVTYINENGYPMLRRCQNCIFWNPENFPEKMKIGYCTKMPLVFAFTLDASIFAITKEFSLCENHKLFKEDMLEKICKKIALKDAIKKKEDIKRNPQPRQKWNQMDNDLKW